MKILLAKEVRNYVASSLEESINKINKIVPIKLNVVRDKVSDSLQNISLDFEEFEGTNCVVLFDMWYDLDSGMFTMTRSDTVTGIKLFSIGELFNSLGLSVPSNISDKVLEYKATGKMDVLFSVEAVAPKTFLSYFLEDVTPKKTNDDILKVLSNLINAVDDLETSLRSAARFGNNPQKQAVNIMSTVPSYNRCDKDVMTEKELYASSCRKDMSKTDNNSEIKAIQAYEIAEAEALRATGGYMDPVVVSVEKTPTFQRITSREKSSIKTSIERNPHTQTILSIEDNRANVIDSVQLRKFFVEVSKCINKVLEV